MNNKLLKSILISPVVLVVLDFLFCFHTQENFIGIFFKTLLVVSILALFLQLFFRLKKQTVGSSIIMFLYILGVILVSSVLIVPNYFLGDFRGDIVNNVEDKEVTPVLGSITDYHFYKGNIDGRKITIALKKIEHETNEEWYYDIIYKWDDSDEVIIKKGAGSHTSGGTLNLYLSEKMQISGTCDKIHDIDQCNSDININSDYPFQLIAIHNDTEKTDIFNELITK